ncbi:MAG: hypothetical protein V1824_03650 [archaeon]
MSEIELIKEEINKIKERNKRVELDKAWELSGFRNIVILILSYIVTTLFFYITKIPNTFIESIIPAIGFFLSTLSLPIFKKIWIKYFHKNK